MGKSTILVAAMAVAIARFGSAADVVIGDFESAPEFGAGSGWFDWSGVATPGTSTTGATRGTKSLAWQPDVVTYYQGLAVKLQNLPTTGPNGDVRAAALQGLLANTHLAMDVTWDPADWIHSGTGPNYAELFSLDINFGPGGTYVGQGFPDTDTGNPDNKGKWDSVNYTTIHTRTVMWDYSHLKSQIQALYTAGTMNETEGYMEFNLATNASSSFQSPVTYYFDNIRFTTPAAVTLAADFNEDNAVNGTDFAAWRNGFGSLGQTNNNNGDADADGDVDGADFLVWQRQFGATPQAASALTTVPEPCGAALALIALAFARRGRMADRRQA